MAQVRKIKGRIPSILQDKKECYVTHRTDSLCVHHVFMGNPNRKLSDKYGLWVYLTGEYHNQSNKGVHCGNHALDMELKQDAQRAFEQTHTRAEFMSTFGKSYL